MRVAVIGDVMLDLLLVGPASRLSPEAPWSPIIDCEWTQRLGGAGFAATALRSMGHEVRLVAAVGDDGHGAAVRGLCEAAGIDPCLGVADRTTVKLSVICTSLGKHVPIVRADQDASESGQLPIDDLTKDMDGILIADYAKGVLWSNNILKLDNSRCPIVADVKPYLHEHLPRCTAITPNQKEANEICELEDANAADLFNQVNCVSAIVTRGSLGVQLFNNSRMLNFCSSSLYKDREPISVSGAGDVFSASLLSELMSENSIENAVAKAESVSTRFVFEGVI